MTRMQPALGVIPEKRSTLTQKIQGFFKPQQLVLLMMVLPAMTALIVFSYIPMSGIVISVKEYTLGKGFFDGNWVGMKYFTKAFTDETFWMATRNTLTISLLHMVFCFPAPVLLALMYNESSLRKLKRFSQTCSYIPHFLSFVVVAAFWQLLLDSDGLVNDALIRLGWITEPIGFWTTPEYYYGIEIIISLWKGIGWDAIIYFAAITAVDQEVYEAALVDGAGRFRRVFSIVMPCILPTVAIKWIMSVSGLFRGSFDASYLLGNNFNREVSYVLEYFITERGISKMKFSYSTAIGQIQAVASLLLLAAANMISKKVTETSIF